MNKLAYVITLLLMLSPKSYALPIMDVDLAYLLDGKERQNAGTTVGGKEIFDIKIPVEVDTSKKTSHITTFPIDFRFKQTVPPGQDGTQIKYTVKDILDGTGAANTEPQMVGLGKLDLSLNGTNPDPDLDVLFSFKDLFFGNLIYQVGTQAGPNIASTITGTVLYDSILFDKNGVISQELWNKKGFEIKVSLQPIPEPSILALISIGFSAFALATRRRPTNHSTGRAAARR